MLTRLSKIYVINLDHRTDRWAEMGAQLARVGLGADAPQVQRFSAVKPEAPDGFPSIGAKGCFISHLEVLREAEKLGHERFLILEDDAEFSGRFLTESTAIFSQIAETEPDITYLGHRILGARTGSIETSDALLVPLKPTVGVQTTHAMVISQAACAKMIPYFEAMLERPPGDPAGGPMHVDGAYSWFRKDHPDCITLITPQEVIGQRSSKSDIYDGGWKERLPFLPLVRRLANRLKHKA